MPHFQYRIEQQRDQKVNGRFKQNYRSTGPNRHMQNTRSTTAEYTFFSSVYGMITCEKGNIRNTADGS